MHVKILLRDVVSSMYILLNTLWEWIQHNKSIILYNYVYNNIIGNDNPYKWNIPQSLFKLTTCIKLTLSKGL